MIGRYFRWVAHHLTWVYWLIAVFGMAFAEFARRWPT